MGRIRRRLRAVFPLLAGALLLPGLVLARIHPNFTPADLVRQADTIQHLELRLGGAELQVQVLNAVKGAASKSATILHLRAAAGIQGRWQQALRAVSPTNVSALWFIGNFTRVYAAQKPASSMLHVNGRWFRLARGEQDGEWIVEDEDPELTAVWNGGTDMLLRAIEYVLKEPQSNFAARATSTWRQPEKLGTVGEKIRSISAVDLHRNGSLSLFVLSPDGDCLFRREAGREEFSRIQPGSKSDAAVWGEFNGDQRLDFVSLHDGALTQWLQTGDATFASTNIVAKFDGPILGLSLWGVGNAAAVMLSDYGPPKLMSRTPQGAWVVRPATDAAVIPSTEFGLAKAGHAADFDGDAVPDWVQPFERGALFYKGRADGLLEAPLPMRGLGSGGPDSASIVGDFDADGWQDFLFVGNDGCHLWQNQGDGRFREVREQSGEITAAIGTNTVGGVTCDFNNDGLHDVVLFHSDRPPQFFFNRGFRSFGWAGEYETETVLGEAWRGQASGLVIDLDEDGAQDMVFVSRTGDLWLTRQSVDEKNCLSLRAVLARNVFPGPITVQAISGARPFSAWNVVAGGEGAFFGLSEAGPVKLRWRFPGRATQERQLMLEESEYRIWLGPEQAGKW